MSRPRLYRLPGPYCAVCACGQTLTHALGDSRAEAIRRLRLLGWYYSAPTGPLCPECSPHAARDRDLRRLHSETEGSAAAASRASGRSRGAILAGWRRLGLPIRPRGRPETVPPLLAPEPVLTPRTQARREARRRRAEERG